MTARRSAKSTRKKVSTPRRTVAKISAKRRSAPTSAVKRKPFNIFKLFEFWLVVPQ